MRFPEAAPTLIELMREADLNERIPKLVAAGVSPTVGDEYLHWDELRSTPPAGLSRRDWWLGIKLARASQLRDIPLRAVNGTEFRYALPDAALELLHWIDIHAAGEIAVSEAIPDSGERRRYLVSSLMEEAITSSQLEGASTTRKEAREMIRTGRRPRDRDEHMILNNYRAMVELQGVREQPLTPDIVNALHRILTENTLNDPSAAGRPQRPGEARVKVFSPDNQVAHTPPPADQIQARMEAMCRFANDDGHVVFQHPVIRAILLHLWLAYDHPYEDGNGRTARALFYREMLRSGYWLFEYISISRLLLRGPAQYARAFLFTESDEYDATYFVLHQLRTIKKAIEEFHGYIDRKMRETRGLVQRLRSTTLNNRQVALLTHALGHPDADYTVTTHSTSHRVTRQSARTDLQALATQGLLDTRKVGKAVHYVPARDLAGRIAVLSEGHA